MRARLTTSYSESDRFGNTRNFSGSFEVDGEYYEVMDALQYIVNTDKIIGVRSLQPIKFIEKSMLEYKKRVK